MMRRAMQILWPSFLAAGMAEMVIFSLIDPMELHWLDGMSLAWLRQTIYAGVFAALWAATALSSALTALLVLEKS